MDALVEDVDVPIMFYEKDEFRETASGNKVCKEVTLCGTQNIILHGKVIIMRDVILRGDLSSIRTGKYCIVGERTVIRTSYKKYSIGFTFFPVYLGDHVLIEEDCVVMAASVGSYVRVGRGSVLGRCSVLKECCRVLPGSVVAPDSVFPPFSIIGGNPARILGMGPECTQDLMTSLTTSFCNNFLPTPS